MTQNCWLLYTEKHVYNRKRSSRTASLWRNRNNSKRSLAKSFLKNYLIFKLCEKYLRYKYAIDKICLFTGRMVINTCFDYSHLFWTDPICNGTMGQVNFTENWFLTKKPFMFFINTAFVERILRGDTFLISVHCGRFKNLRTWTWSSVSEQFCTP